MKNGVVKILAVCVCGLMVAGAFMTIPRASRNAEAASTTPITLTVGVGQTVDSLNPFSGTLTMAYEVYVLMYEMLVGVDKDLNPVPQIAESWEHNVDGTVWTYHIRHGMTWHDGVPVTANDVNFTYNLILTSPTAGALNIDYLKNVTDVRALDDYTLQITTEVPKATMQSIIISIVPEHLWGAIPPEKVADADVFDTTYFPDGPVGSGPFKLVSAATDDFWKFERYDGYWGPKVHFDELTFKYFTSSSAILNALYSGSIDIAGGVPSDSWEKTLSKPGIRGQAVHELALTELGINCCPPSLRPDGASTNYETLNLSVRKAIAMAVNKTQMVRDVIFGLAEPGDVFIPPASARWHYNLTTSEKYKFDIAAANALLDAAGYVDSNSDGIRENSTNGVALNFQFNFIVDSPENEADAYLIQGWLKQIGIKADPQGISESTLTDYWYGMNYDMFIWGWGGDADPSFIASVFTTGQIPTEETGYAAWSDCFYSNPYYDSLFVQQQNTVDIAARQAILYEMQRIIYRDSPYVILYNAYGLYAYREDRFTNWPDITAHPGMTPLSGFTGGPWLYYEILPYSGNLPPRNVDAGPDTVLALGETRSFTGYAEDEDPANLTWTWNISEPGDVFHELTGRTISYTFDIEGTVLITLTVADSGDPPLDDRDQIVATVVELAQAGWLAGYVKDTQGHAIAAADVTAELSSATTDLTGYYNMTLAPGPYDVTASRDGYLTGLETTTVVLDQTTALDFALTNNSGSLRGHVYYKDTTKPLEGVVVSLRKGDINKLYLTDASGAYNIDMLEAGTYSVNVTKAGYETNMTSVVIQVGLEKILDARLEPLKTGGGVSTVMLAAIAAIIVIVAVAVVVLMLKRRKKEPAEGQPPKVPELPKP